MTTLLITALAVLLLLAAATLAVRALARWLDRQMDADEAAAEDWA